MAGTRVRPLRAARRRQASNNGPGTPPFPVTFTIIPVTRRLPPPRARPTCERCSHTTAICRFRVFDVAGSIAAVLQRDTSRSRRWCAVRSCRSFGMAKCVPSCCTLRLAAPDALGCRRATRARSTRWTSTRRQASWPPAAATARSRRASALVAEAQSLTALAHAQLWELTTEADGYPGVRFLDTLCGHSRTVNALRFSPTGELLASGVRLAHAQPAVSAARAQRRRGAHAGALAFALTPSRRPLLQADAGEVILWRPAPAGAAPAAPSLGAAEGSVGSWKQACRLAFS
jgi:hypothetical protein